MSWNFHHYYTNRSDGLIGNLLLNDSESNALKVLRQKVRVRTRDIFNEAKTLVLETRKDSSFIHLSEKISMTKFKYLSMDDQKAFIKLILQLDDTARTAFSNLSPRFWTQGSFTYDTLNKPYCTPPQEMDIDDGTYLPMVFFDDKPLIGHQLLLLLVDTSLKSLVAENSDWRFEAKRTCGRIVVPLLNAHIDVPMYAIPEEKFLEKEQALKESKDIRLSCEAFDSALIEEQKKYILDSDCVNLAIRDDEEKWMVSDPKVVDEWFKLNCARIGPHLRKICRFLKAWRDAQWKNGGGPSSISLMAATVNILNQTVVHSDDFGKTMFIIAQELPKVFRSGIDSPDESDERPLFPSSDFHQEKERQIIQKMEAFSLSLEAAFLAESKLAALNILNSNFGNRVQDHGLIVNQNAAPAFDSEPSQAKAAFQISSTMKSG